VNFDLTDEQRLLSESVTRFVRERYDFAARERSLHKPEGWSREVWGEMAELGLLALPFAADDGGFDGGGVEIMIVMEALGRGLVVEPYLATVVLAGGVLRHAASPVQRSARAPAIAAGDLILALAHNERTMPRHSVADVRATAKRDGAGWRLSGEKIAVINGDSADEFIVSAQTKGGLSLFLATKEQAQVRAQRAYDGTRVAVVTFDDVLVSGDGLVGAEGEGGETLTRVFEEAVAAVAAEAVGVMSDTLDLTVSYLKTRQQFGAPIGSFQALQHRAVDMLTSVELARSMAILAALALQRAGELRWRDIAAAKVQIGKSGRFVGQNAVQLHGAIGITAEYKVGHALKRLTAIDALFGDADHHLDALAAAGGLAAADQ